MQSHYLHALLGVVRREVLRFLQQRERLIASLVRPILWFVIFSAGLKASLHITAGDAYAEAVDNFSYEMYILPGLIAMIQLFSGMQSALSIVYDREMGSMRVLLVSPLPRWYLLFCKLFAAAVISLLQVYIFLFFASFFNVGVSLVTALMLLPQLLLSGLCFSAIGLFLSSLIKQLENFAGVMNFVIFPLFFLSSALYPLENFQQSSKLLFTLAQYNPFTHAVEMLRYTLTGNINLFSSGYVFLCIVGFCLLANYGYNPARGVMKKKYS
jgi:ABC-2 type transport system permease protein